jgi:dynactin-4
MTVNSLDVPSDPAAEETSKHGGPFHLYCNYCHWSTLEIGIEFEKHTGITQQLSRVANGGKLIPPVKEREKERERRKELESKKRNVATGSDELVPTDARKYEYEKTTEDVFSALSSFYKSQIQATTSSNPFSAHDISFSSPSSFTRIMNLYSSTSSKKQKREKPAPMREAASALEGLTLHDPTRDAAIIDRINREGWGATLSPAQKFTQTNPNARFTSDLRPVATILRTKRGKRCRNCRHILAKPESKITSTRYKIKLVAANHIPRLTLRALPQLPLPPPTTQGGIIINSVPPVYDYDHLQSGHPTHFLLTLANPLFDPIRVTLATPSTTPGKVQSRVTILCPQFDVGANTDVWDDALASSLSPTRDTQPQTLPAIEAGKVWDAGRNWTTIVVEVVPGFLKPVPGLPSTVGVQTEEETNAEDVELDEDDDVLEIPIFVRLEFEVDPTGEERGLTEERTKGGKEKREEAFWTVVGVGRVAES